MGARKKAGTHKERWQANRARYTWHLRTPFDKLFDRSHWWKSSSEIEPVGALYEIARRHPLVHETWLRIFKTACQRPYLQPAGIAERWKESIMRPVVGCESVPPSLYWTCLLGLKSWAELDYTDRKNWEACVGHLKGCDFRDEDLQCRSINVLADWKIRDQREDTLSDKLKGKGRAEEVGKIISADLAVKPATPEEWEAAIAFRAVEAHRRGYLILAVAPDLPIGKAASLMEKVYGFARRIYARPKQRARWQNWLPLISEFETDEAGKSRAKSQVFAHYRRILDDIQFT